MNWLPNATAAHIDDAKIRDYLLDPGNAQNGGKATRFTQNGFDPAHWQTLGTALRNHPLTNPIAEIVPSSHGIKYVVKCYLQTPDERNPCRTSVWIVDVGGDIPRFVTAY